MKTTILFTDKVRLLYKEFDHYTTNGNGIYTYIFERLERLDTFNDITKPEWKKYEYFNSIKMSWQNIVNQDPGTRLIIEYTRRGKSWDFKLLNTIQDPIK